MSAAELFDRLDDLSAQMRYGLLALLALAFFLPGLSALPPVDRDESRFAQASKQMVESGDYVDIRFQDRPRHKKPAGIYWMQAASVHLTGIRDQIWVYRLPSLLGAVAAVLLTAWIGTMLFAPGIGFGSGVVMAGAVLLNVEARTAKTDAMLLAATLLALALMIRVFQSRQAVRSAHGFWAALGLAVLIKGPIPFLPIVGLAAARSWQMRSLRWLADLRPLTGLPLFLLIALPWYVAIAVISDGGFFAESLGKDLVNKVASGQESHGAPPGLYLALAPLTFWPFSLFGLMALPWIWRNRRTEPVWWLLGWVLLTWIVFAATPTKLAHYVLPVYPALAILAVAALAEGGSIRRWWQWIALSLWSLICLALMGAMPGLGIALDLPFDIVWLGGILLLPMLYAGWRCFDGFGASARDVGLILLSAVLFSGLVFGRFLPSLEPAFISPRLVAALPDRPGCDRPWLTSTGFNEPSLAFLTETRTLLTTPEGAADHLKNQPDCGVASIEARQQQRFLDRVAANGQNIRAVGTVDGFNYAQGKRLTITLYIVEPTP